MKLKKVKYNDKNNQKAYELKNLKLTKYTQDNKKSINSKKQFE